MISLLSSQHRFQPQNPLGAAQQFSPREAGADDETEVRLSAQTLLLPTKCQIEARMMVSAFEMGLDNVTEDAVSSLLYALEVSVSFIQLKNIISVLHCAHMGHRLESYFCFHSFVYY